MLVVNGIRGCPVKFKVTRYKIGANLKFPPEEICVMIREKE